MAAVHSDFYILYTVMRTEVCISNLEIAHADRGQHLFRDPGARKRRMHARLR